MTARIRDRGLWRAGRDRIDWAAPFMPVTRTITEHLRKTGAIAGARIGLVLVLEPKTANLALGLAHAGAEVTVVSAARNTHDDVAAALDRAGIAVFARSDAAPHRDREFALGLLDRNPDILVDDGSAVIRLAHTERPQRLGGLLGATEETTSGLRPLRVMAHQGELRIPVLAVNDARAKTLFDNGHGTGQSTLFTILDLLRTTVDRKRVVVAGFGPVGRGFARHAAALGALVTIAEVDPVRALEAVFAGYEVAPLVEAAATADLLVSATGIAHTIDLPHLLALPEGAAVAVAGGVEQEIALDAAFDAGARNAPAGPHLTALTLPNDRTVLVLDDGGCINCTVGEGNPIEVMDLSFGVQASAIDFLARHDGELEPAVHALPAEVDERVAAAKLDSLGIRLERQSAAQRDFLAEWRPADRPRAAVPEERERNGAGA